MKNPDLQTERAIRMAAFWLVDSLGDNVMEFDNFMVLYNSNLQAKEIKETIYKFINTQGLNIKDCMPELVNTEIVEKMVREVLSAFPEQIEKYKAGDEKIANFLVGKVMAQAKGKAPAGTIKEKVLKELTQ